MTYIDSQAVEGLDETRGKIIERAKGSGSASHLWGRASWNCPGNGSFRHAFSATFSLFRATPRVIRCKSVSFRSGILVAIFCLG
jgi:hypothetical protein